MIQKKYKVFCWGVHVTTISANDEADAKEMTTQNELYVEEDTSLP